MGHLPIEVFQPVPHTWNSNDTISVAGNVKDSVSQFEEDIVGPAASFDRGLEIVVHGAASRVVSDSCRHVELRTHICLV